MVKIFRNIFKVSYTFLSRVALLVKNTLAMRCRFDPWVGKIPWRRAGQRTLYSCLDNPMDRGAWWATVRRVAKSWTRLSDFTSPHQGDYRLPS